jgi:rare lipoprotein A (peptidoglycan hydrolase)
MKQNPLNSKWGLSALAAKFVPGCIQDNTRQLEGMRMLFWRSFRCVSLVTLMGALALSACTSKDSGEYPSKHVTQIPQKQENATTKPVHKEVGEASWYGGKFQGQETANGENFNQNNMTAAHPSLPMGTMAKVTNLENGKKIDVRINDRGPFQGARAIDLSSAAAKKIDMKKDGTTEVKIETKLSRKSSPHQVGKTKNSAKGRHHKRRQRAGT